ncbi:MAG TPA: hypothetical protein VK922_04705 [Gemmatimonadaceae bacterium]|nr:hypothetical protein [Gemmatimonadaceae bacterium]
MPAAQPEGDATPDPYRDTFPDTLVTERYGSTELPAADPKRPPAFGEAAAEPSPAPSDFFGPGEMGAVLRGHDWSRTPFGPVDHWPSNLRTTVGIVMHSRFPMLLWWGPELRQIYNDAYRPVLGAKHPRAVGQPGAQVWAEIWDILGPRADQARAMSHATWDEDLFLPMDRYGFTEETYFTFSYSPVPDTEMPGRSAGVLVTCTETTQRVLGERRVRSLRDLGARSSEAKTAEEACAIAAATVASNTRDVPFITVYLLDDHGDRCTWRESVGSSRARRPRRWPCRLRRAGRRITCGQPAPSSRLVRCTSWMMSHAASGRSSPGIGRRRFARR